MTVASRVVPDPGDTQRTIHTNIMAVEVEQKFRCDDLGAVREALVRHGAAGGKTIEQVDRYYRHPVRDFAATDEAFRMRTVGERNYLTYKGPKLDAQTKTRREDEVGIADGPAAAATCHRMLVQLGFEPVAEVRKQREVWQVATGGREVEASLDAVAGVGEFVELEIQVDASGDDEGAGEIEAARQALVALAKALGLRNVERRSYLELLLSKAE
jgi:adenylate cyclase class 2